jgi:hypothetical protein
MQTHRTEIVLKDIIFDYITFNNPIFKNLLELLKNTILSPQEKFETEINVYGLSSTFALGGLHSNNTPKLIKEDNDNIIITSDVASYYPNLSIQNDIKPLHLGGSFSKIYKGIYEERKQYDKKNPLNYVLKIVLNSAYGLSSEKNTYLYDVAFTRAICINGQLLLFKLCEMIKEEIPDVQFIMLNTDGLEVKIPKRFKDTYFNVASKWEKLTKLVLEHSSYKLMAIRDVNNYLSIDTKGNVKKKGVFENEMDYHKNPSFLIIPKAVEAYFVKGLDYRNFINNHDDIFDFLGAVKKKSNFELNLYSFDGLIIKAEPQQKVTRFYVAKKGRKFYKDFKDGRRVGILKDWYVESCNKITNETIEEIKSNLDLRFYYKEVEKLITEIEKKQQLELCLN